MVWKRNAEKDRENWKQNRIGKDFNITEEEEINIMSEVTKAEQMAYFKGQLTDAEVVKILFPSLSGQEKMKIFYFAKLMQDWGKRGVKK